MRAVSRGAGAAPAALSARNRAGQSELDRARAHQINPDPKKKSFEYAAYSHDEVKARLTELFHGKCAYCETFYSASAPVDVEHYRPKGAVAEDDTHPGYWWLAMSWENLLPSCIDCNRKRNQRIPGVSASLKDLHDQGAAGRMQTVLAGKMDSFPLAAAGRRAQPELGSFEAEQALLLDPTRDKPQQHLRFYMGKAVPLGLVLPAVTAGIPSERGAVSIQVYGLNRLGLVQERTRILRRLEFLGDLAVELAGLVEQVTQPAVLAALEGAGAGGVPARLRLLQDRTLAEIRDMADERAPYSTMASAWIAEFKKSLGA